MNATGATKASPVSEAQAPPKSLLASVATMVGSGMSNQVGAGAGAHAFNAIGPAGVVAVRQIVAAAILLPLARPNVRRMTWAQWWPTLLLALVFVTMNLSLYIAIDRIGLGLAVTLEFLGPLGVALGSSRTRAHLVAAVSAAVGVYVLVMPGPSSDYIGIGLALVAAACWAGYILLNRTIGSRLPGLEAPAIATTLSALLYLPVIITLTAQGRMSGMPLLYAIASGLLSSVVPYAADLIVLRHVPARFFGTFMSMHPVWAALAGLVLLNQVPALHVWVGIAIIALSNLAAVLMAHENPAANQRHPQAERSTGPAICDPC